MTEFLLVRHGQSTYNAEGRWQGQADAPLSDLGRLQAEHAARSVGSVDVIVASDLQRARHTAEIIAESAGIGPVVIEPELKERSAGEWSGLTRAEIERDWPGYLDAGDRPPGWEPQDALMDRAFRALTRLHERYDGAEVLVVTHGGVVYAIEEHLGEPWARIGNLEARRLTLDTAGPQLGERVELIDHDEITVPDQL